MKSSHKPLLSVRLMVYNNEPHIRQAIEGILNQQTNFLVEVVVGDDFSSDKTLNIIKNYGNTENIVFNILERKVGDQYWQDRKRLGRLYNFKNILDNCSGKYVALLDGDDYWIDSQKLQKQVDFLESNKSYGICAHTVHEINEFDAKRNRVIPKIKEDKDFTIKEFIIHNKTASCSLVLRTKLLSNLTKSFCDFPFGDLTITLTALKHSNKKIRVFKDVMANYRVHSGGLHGELRENSKKQIKAYKQHIRFTDLIKKTLLTEKIYESILKQKKMQTYALLTDLSKKNKMYFSWLGYKMKHYFFKFILKPKN